MKNEELRKCIAISGLKYWEIAEELGIHETTFSKRLRKELPQEEKNRILLIIEKLKKNHGR